ncbi:hypothetical protein [Microcoleus sp. T2B6]
MPVLENGARCDIKGTFGHSFTSLNRFCPVDLGFFYSIVLLHILYSF